MPELPSADELQLVQASFGRCLLKKSFFEEFYEELFASSPTIARKFRGVDMERQKAVVEDGIVFMLMYARGSTAAEFTLRRVARIHAPDRVNVEPDLYPRWVDALCRTVRRTDPDFSDRVERAWRRTMQPGIDFFVAHWKAEKRNSTSP